MTTERKLTSNALRKKTIHALETTRIALAETLAEFEALQKRFDQADDDSERSGLLTSARYSIIRLANRGRVPTLWEYMLEYDQLVSAPEDGRR